jgi:hypothetical protein
MSAFDRRPIVSAYDRVLERLLCLQDYIAERSHQYCNVLVEVFRNRTGCEAPDVAADNDCVSRRVLTTSPPTPGHHLAEEGKLT